MGFYSWRTVRPVQTHREGEEVITRPTQQPTPSPPPPPTPTSSTPNPAPFPESHTHLTELLVIVTSTAAILTARHLLRRRPQGIIGLMKSNLVLSGKADLQNEMILRKLEELQNGMKKLYTDVARVDAQATYYSALAAKRTDIQELRKGQGKVMEELERLRLKEYRRREAIPAGDEMELGVEIETPLQGALAGRSDRLDDAVQDGDEHVDGSRVTDEASPRCRLAK